MDLTYLNEEMPKLRHSMPVQLRFNDIDILGHLNNIVYFSLYDLAKARYLEYLYGGEIDFSKVETAIANVNCTYITQIKFGEEIEVRTRVLSVGDRSFTLRQALVEKSSNEIRSVCDSVMVCFDPATGKSAPMSTRLRAALDRATADDADAPKGE